MNDERILEQLQKDHKDISNSFARPVLWLSISGAGYRRTQILKVGDKNG